MFKKYLIIASFFFLFLINIDLVSADVLGKTIATNLALRVSATTDSAKITYIPSGSVVSVLNTTPEVGTGCSSGWYKIKYNENIGYVCSKYVSFYIVNELAIERDPINEMEIVWKSEGFPSSYWEKLTTLKTLHPNYIFKAIKTDLDWETVISNESYLGTSFIQVSDLNSTRVAYISTAGGSYDYVNKKYIVQEGSSWYAADSRVVAYYMDPRNFISEARIFMFEDLAYTGTFITAPAIEKIFSGNFAYLAPYAQAFVDAGVASQVNPIYLASLSRQELGGGSSITVSGAKFCYPLENSNYPDEKGLCYEQFYNFFNIGAGTDAKPVYNSLIYAKNRGWNTPLLAVTGGANMIGSKYIKIGQNTSYFKKYNVKPGATYATYSNQFMTNVQAPSSESSTAYSGYKNLGVLESDSIVPFTFEIPIYKNMPTVTELPTEPLFLSANDQTVIDTLLANTAISNDGTYLKNLANTTILRFKELISAVSQNVTINILDAVGNAKSDGLLVTGDRITFTFDEESQQYQVVITGDTSGDGAINIIDLLQIQKHLLSASTLDNAYFKAADVNGNGAIDILDLLKVQKHILGESIINS